MVWACCTSKRLGPIIICDGGRIEGNEYEDILYDDLVSLIDDLLESLEDANIIQVTNENTFLFM
jgi:hypothetical protein